MIRLISLLLRGHVHTWSEPFARGPIMEGRQAVGSYYHCRCSKCGAIRKFNLFSN